MKLSKGNKEEIGKMIVEIVNSRTEVTHVDNSIDLDDRFKNVWDKRHLLEVMMVKAQLIFKKTDEYGFSYCQAGLSSIIENLRRKFHRFMKQTNGMPVDLQSEEGVTDDEWEGDIHDILESLIDLGNYADLAMLFIQHCQPEHYNAFLHKTRTYCQPIITKLGFPNPTEAEKRGFVGMGSKDLKGKNK